MLVDEWEYLVAAICNSIVHRFGKLFKKRYANMINSTNIFIPKVEKVLRKNITEGEALYMNNINESTNEFTIIDSGPLAKVNLFESHVLLGSTS